jgi:hypothetical protein
VSSFSAECKPAGRLSACLGSRRRLFLRLALLGGAEQVSGDDLALDL